MLLVLEVQESNRKLEGLNVTLEQKVEERTSELTQRGRDMRLVLDNVAQGFLTIDAEGYLAQERSAIVDRWFGPYEGEITFADYARSIDREFGERFELAFEAYIGGLPADRPLPGPATDGVPVEDPGLSLLVLAAGTRPSSTAACSSSSATSPSSWSARRRTPSSATSWRWSHGLMRDRSGYLVLLRGGRPHHRGGQAPEHRPGPGSGGCCTR